MGGLRPHLICIGIARALTRYKAFPSGLRPHSIYIDPKREAFPFTVIYYLLSVL